MFRKGQKVICCSMTKWYATKLNIGEIYTIESFQKDPSWILVKECAKKAQYELKHFIPLSKLSKLIFKRTNGI